MAFGDYISSSAAAAHLDASGTANLSVTLGAAVSVGDWIVGMIGWDANATPTSIDDNLGGSPPNNYVMSDDSVHDAGHNQDGRTFRCKVTVAGTPVITAHWNSGQGSQRIIVAAYAGGIGSRFDRSIGQAETAPGTGTDGVNSTTVTTTEANDLCVGFLQNIAEQHPGTGSIAPGTNYTERLDEGAAILAVEDRHLTDPGSVEATFTISNDHSTICHIVTICQVPDRGGPGRAEDAWAAIPIAGEPETTGAVTLTPAAVAAAWSVATPTLLKGGVTLTPNATVAAWSIATPTLIKVNHLVPNAVVAAFSVVTPTVVKGVVQLIPSAVIAVWSVVTPVVSMSGGDVILIPNAVVAAWSIATPTVVKGIVQITPSPVVGSFAVVAPNVARGVVTLLPGAVTAVWSIPAVTVIKGSRILIPGPVIGTFSVATPVVVGGEAGEEPIALYFRYH